MVALFVIFTVVVCVMADSVVQWRKARREAALQTSAANPATAYAFADVSAPAGVFLDSGHTWVELAPSGTAHVGLDRFAESVLGRIDAVELPKVGTEVHRGERLFALRQGERTAEFVAPIDGIVTEVDESLARHPEAIQADPYKEGWVCTLNPKNLGRNLKRLRVAEEARTWLKEEVERFQDFFAARPLEHTALGQVLQDGGQPTGGVLEVMDDETWEAFTDSFLHPSEQAENHEA